MRSAGSSTPPPEDLTARARIRDAAIVRWGTDGFGTGLRAVAADAGVSAGLVIHHFGSKDGLRAACDEHVFEIVRTSKTESVGGTGDPLAQLASMDEYAPLLAYVVRTLQAGGPAARAFVERMIDDAAGYVRAGVAAGTIRPSRDEHARARFMTLASLGALLLHVALDEPDIAARPAATMRAWSDSIALPALELYTDGFFTSGEILDGYLAYSSDPPPSDAPPHP
ncbi:TetR/AcrR family transcriptional regulator [Paraoerskovia marina]|uniref:DNA-binding transcriptional regulator, AcrR family n=1 Tax=Paraoerskovia marina TaxID=545619 RepID=A0A1H1PMC0_9CELL|nr:TetR family transcriptional regulator [Paraoerskovia marina]SDS12244.1 DNA-binding transcriptional regulator, AcrR family [Paraoerskovia marina]